MPRTNNGNGRNRQRRNGNTSTGPSRSPTKALRRTFRHVINYKLENSTGSGTQQYCYFSRMLLPDPASAIGFKDAQQTFEFWRLRKFRIRAQLAYNDYNQTYNTINLAALAAIQIWTVADLSANETISGESIYSYNNAKVNTLSLNNIKTLVNTGVRVNLKNDTPSVLLPSSTWLDTSADLTSAIYSGAQMYAKMPGVNATNYLPEISLIFEYDVEFKQPAYQNRPTTFETQIIGSLLEIIPDPNLPEDFRTYVCTDLKLSATGLTYRFARQDGLPGPLTYDAAEMFRVYHSNTSGQYFNDRRSRYTGPPPRKPLGWTP